jgi:hypothetical protein
MIIISKRKLVYTQNKKYFRSQFKIYKERDTINSKEDERRKDNIN